MTPRTTLPAILAALAVGALAAAPALAQEAEGWRFQVTPYLWGAAIDGALHPGGGWPTVEVARSRGEVLDSLEAAFFLTAGARNGRFVILGDLSYADLAESDTLRLPATPISPAFDFPIRTELKLTAATVVAGYAAVDRPDLTVDLMVGARFWHARAETRATRPLAVLPDSISGRDSWVDPVLAARARYAFSEDWSVLAYGDYGGFGINSDETWQVAATVNYRLSDRFYLSGGYRVLGLDHAYDGMRLDTRLGGPLVGVTARF